MQLCVETITLFRQFLDNFNKDEWEHALSGSNSPIHPFVINPFCGLNHLTSSEAQLSSRYITIKVKGSLTPACFLPSLSTCRRFYQRTRIICIKDILSAPMLSQTDVCGETCLQLHLTRDSPEDFTTCAF